MSVSRSLDEKASARAEILKYSPTGKVPAFVDKQLGVVVCESIAIVYHIADRFPEANLLPKDPVARASSSGNACRIRQYS